MLFKVFFLPDNYFNSTNNRYNILPSFPLWRRTVWTPTVELSDEKPSPDGGPLIHNRPSTLLHFPQHQPISKTEIPPIFQSVFSKNSRAVRTVQPSSETGAARDPNAEFDLGPRPERRRANREAGRRNPARWLAVFWRGAERRGKAQEKMYWHCSVRALTARWNKYVKLFENIIWITYHYENWVILHFRYLRKIFIENFAL